MFQGYDPNYPIIIGFSGAPGSGKTSTADFIRPMGISGEGAEVEWDHLWHSIPLYELVSIKTMVKGVDSQNRQLHQIHDVVKDVLRSVIPYDDMIELVYDLYAMPIKEDGKPRAFLQQAGSLFRKYNKDCFAEWIHVKVRQHFSDFQRASTINFDQRPPFVAIISDVRMMNEAELLKSQPNSFLIKLTASEEVLNHRLLKRDNFLLSNEEANHESEGARETLEFNDLVDVLINTDDFIDDLNDDGEPIRGSGATKQGKYVKQVIMDLIQSMHIEDERQLRELHQFS